MSGEQVKQVNPFSNRTPLATRTSGVAAPARSTSAPSAPLAPAQSANGNSRTPTARSRPKALIVEDYAPCMDAYKIALEDVRDVELFFADCGQEAIDLIRQHSFAIVITDLGLPDYSGYEVKEEHARIKPHETPRYILVTGYDSEEQRKKSRDLGFDEHIEKPISILRLLNLIDDCTADGDPAA